MNKILEEIKKGIKRNYRVKIMDLRKYDSDAPNELQQTKLLVYDEYEQINLFRCILIKEVNNKEYNFLKNRYGYHRGYLTNFMVLYNKDKHKYLIRGVLAKGKIEVKQINNQLKKDLIDLLNTMDDDEKKIINFFKAHEVSI